MVKVVVTDIEGTTSSISFVKDVLFPYAAEHMLAFLEKHWHEDAVQAQIQAMAEHLDSTPTDAQQANTVLQQWIAEDRKFTPLKALQGMIWKDGYRSGAYRAHLYPEVAARLQKWKQQGLRLYVYSSGSIGAQKLFFGFSEAGDITSLFDGYFDTTTGGKRDPLSYQRISEAVGIAPGDILFLSDIVEELDAARAAGMHTTLLDRQHQALPCTHPCVDSFVDIDPLQ